MTKPRLTLLALMLVTLVLGSVHAFSVFLARKKQGRSARSFKGRPPHRQCSQIKPSGFFLARSSAPQPVPHVQGCRALVKRTFLHLARNTSGAFLGAEPPKGRRAALPPLSVPLVNVEPLINPFKLSVVRKSNLSPPPCEPSVVPPACPNSLPPVITTSQCPRRIVFRASIIELADEAQADTVV